MQKEVTQLHSASAESTACLDLFHPLIRKWFLEKVGTPTDIQSQAWPEIARGEHVLVTAPTGSGKTLTAFLWAINNFLEGKNPSEHQRVIYISPLKALNNDIQRNLNAPLQELQIYFAEAGATFPVIRTAVRSGDTEPSERRKMMRQPPEIFITTPESLNIMLTSKSGRKMLTGISTVILDEIHAVLPFKRGSYLITAIDRMVALNGEIQRIALSATVKPLDLVADFIGGYKIKNLGGEFSYQKRRVSIIRSQIKKQYNISVQFPEGAGDSNNTEVWWPALTDSFRKVIGRNHSSLFFANSRRMVEKITRFINDTEGDRVYSHHGSLSKEIRSVVEKRFKEGELSAIIATSSLELGIDIGSVDEVVLIQAPTAISSAIQRIGRSGHGVDQVSKGVFYPIHSRDFLEAAVLAANIDGEAIESMKPLEAPLDVLAQVLLSMMVAEERNLDDLYGEIRASYPYHKMSRKEFDLVIEMLAGRYADARIRELKPRLLVDRVKNTAKARENTAPLLYLSGGVIPDRGYFNLRVADTKAKIGELDEEFVWERSLGDAFPLGNQVWRILKVTHNDVEVAQVSKTNTLIPFWRAEEMNRSFHLSEKIGHFLEESDKGPEDKEFKKKLETLHHMSPRAANELSRYLKSQQKETGAALPHRHHILIEHFRDPVNLADSKQTVLHTLWGGRVNRPFAFALSAAWEEKYGQSLEVFVNNDCIMVNLPHSFSGSDIIGLVKPGKIRQSMRTKLESTGYFGARFRENAGRALLLPKQNFKARMPLWLNRMRSKKLLEAVSQYNDFPILLETWRGCLNNDFEIDTLENLLEEIQGGEITITEVVTKKPSPFADGIIWRQTNQFMYEDDSPGSKLRTNLSDSLLKEVMYASHIRPRFSKELLNSFRAKLHRVTPGYAPDSGEELLQWVKERLYIPAKEWQELLLAINRDYDIDSTGLTKEIEKNLYYFNHEDSLVAVLALENLPRISHALGFKEERAQSIAAAMKQTAIFDQDPEETLVAFLGEWLRFYGPVEQGFLESVLHSSQDRLAPALQELLDEERILVDEFREGVEDLEEICEIENLEILLRIRRSKARPTIEPKEIDHLPLFMATYQGLTSPGDNLEDLQESLETLFGYPARASLWETDILPARLSPYYSSWMDSALRDNELLWFGCGAERIGFCFESDYELFAFEMGNGGPVKDNKKENSDNEKYNYKEAVQQLDDTLRASKGKFELTDLAKTSQLTSLELTTSLWQLAWQGRVTNDHYKTIRMGVMNKFRPLQPPPMRQRSSHGRGRVNFNRWQAGRALTGNWYALPDYSGDDLDALDRQDLVKDRIRQLFMRYGILFRELLWNELPTMRWAQVFRVLRLMELSGEIVSGHFFKGIPGLQFCTISALTLFTKGLPEDAIFWMNAADPASPCGMGLEQLKPMFPHRLATTHIVFHGKNPVLISKKNGKELIFNVPPDHVKIDDYLELFKVLVGREFQPLKYVSVETINDEPALDSPYKKPLQAFGFKKDYKALALMKSY
jgi:ATP-dependent helicase Lhr and Lhr-like helicase